MKILLSMILIIACGVLIQAEHVKVGFSVQDVTPTRKALAKGVKIDGWSRPIITVAVKADDQLFVRTMAMRDKHNTLLVVVTVDTLKFYPADIIAIQDWFEKKYKISRWHLLINSSHVHQAPRCFPLDKDPYAKIYHDLLIKAMRLSISDAIKNAITPMTIKYAKLKISKDMIFNKNKRHGFKDIETDLDVFAFFDVKTNKIKGFMWTIAAHFTWAILAPEKRVRVSSHIPGAVSRALKKYYGEDAVAMLAQGAAGELKVQFPEFKDTKWVYNRTLKRGEVRWNKGVGAIVTYQQYIKALDNYGDRIAKIIQKGFANGIFKQVKDINLKVSGKDAIIKGLAKDKIPAKTKLGIKTRPIYYGRKLGAMRSREYYDKQIAESKNEDSLYLAKTMRWMMNDKGQRIYHIPFYKVKFNNKLQIVAMGTQCCCGIGKIVKNFYKKNGMQTVFWGFTPFCVYYPTNELHKAGIYQAAFFFAEDPNFDYEKFVLDNVKSLK